jgi:putative PIN family toxin of toxin-antitoxin system
MIRAVVDTNIFIRALIRPQGTVGPIIPRLAREEYKLIYSKVLLEELNEKIHLPRLQERYKVQEYNIQALLDAIALRGDLVTPTRTVKVCRDEDDNRVLEAAVAGKADYIVTSDEDLLVLDPFEGIRIVRPHVFLAALK